MRNFTLPFKVLIFTAVMCFTAFKLKAQCNSGFSYTIQAQPGYAFATFSADDPAFNKNHVWYSNDSVIGFGAVLNHAYYQAGQYTIRHIIFDSVNNCTDSTVKVINVGLPPYCQSDFYSNTSMRDSVVAGSCLLYASPTVYNSAITNYIWSINGAVVDSSHNSSYTVTQPGIDYVCLTITTDSGCSTQICKLMAVFSRCNMSPSFTYKVDSLNAGSVTFYPHPDSAQLTYRWTINGGYAYVKNLVTQYYQGGTYAVSLYVFDTGKKCFDSTAGTVIVPPFPCDTFHVSYTYHFAADDSSTVYFTAQSNEALTGQYWTIRSLYDSSLNISLATPDPLYRFADTGHYLACITPQTAGFCSGGYCDVIYVAGTGHVNNILTSYPNPVSDEVNISVPCKTAGKLSINVYSAGGTRVYSLQKQAVRGYNQVKIPVSMLQPGQYFIDITSVDGRTKSVFQKF